MDAVSAGLAALTLADETLKALEAKGLLSVADSNAIIEAAAMRHSAHSKSGANEAAAVLLRAHRR